MIHHMETRVSTRGRVTIPIEIRRELGIKPGTKKTGFLDLEEARSI